MLYLNVIPYCATDSKPDFHTSVTSHAFVAWRRQERKADTALPPTIQNLFSIEAINGGTVKR